MISRLRGTLLASDPMVEIATSGGVVYEVEVPTTVLPRLPGTGQSVELRTVQVVREDSVALYGFLTADERTLFQRLLTGSGIGPKVAISMLSTFPAARLVRVLREKDSTALRQVSGIGKKTAEKLVLELADRVADLSMDPGGDGGSPGSTLVSSATQALVALGFSFVEADEAVRAVLAEEDVDSAEVLIRKALANRR
jgi:Holliday junction DNA helicase RuvA